MSPVVKRRTSNPTVPPRPVRDAQPTRLTVRVGMCAVFMSFTQAEDRRERGKRPVFGVDALDGPFAESSEPLDEV